MPLNKKIEKLCAEIEKIPQLSVGEKQNLVWALLTRAIDKGYLDGELLDIFPEKPEN